MHETIGKVVTKNWELVANGTRITKELAAFFKEINPLVSIPLLVFVESNEILFKDSIKII
jgi:hypothetical protein